MDSNKHLLVTKRGNTYEDENKAEQIKIILPKIINNHNLIDCIVNLNVIDSENVGDVIDITSLLLEYSDNFYFAEIPMTNTLTYASGNIKIWIKVIDADSNMIAKSGIATYSINSHIDIEETIPEKSLSLLDEWQIKMDNVLKQVQDIADGISFNAEILEKQINDLQEFVEPLKQGEVFLV